MHILVLIFSQAAIGSQFLWEYPSSYLKYSYELGRVFLYKWTVNWRFVSEETFLSTPWARALLFGHVATLIAFGAFRWCRRDGGTISVLRRGLCSPSQAPSPALVTSDCKLNAVERCSTFLTNLDSDVITVLFTSNLIGILFARSLHYQFYSWYAQQLPFLAWRTRYPTPVKYVPALKPQYR
jgi:alpha-1,3-mannosyltransferase